MKILKYIFLLLILSAIAATVFIATQSGKYNITQEKVIFAPKETLFGYINDYKNWENLGLLTGADTTAIYNYSENTAGTGAAMQWEKGETRGSIKTLKSQAADSIVQDANINGLGSNLKWHFKDTLGGTKVSVTIKGELTFTEKAQALLNSDKINKTYSLQAAKGLNSLNTFLVSDLKKYNVHVAGKVKKNSSFYLGHSVTTTRAEINQTALANFKKLVDFTGKNKIVTAGEPFILFKNYSHTRDTLTYMLCVPIKEQIFTSQGSEFEGGRLPAFNALKTTLTGDYSHLPKAWAASGKHIAEKALPENPALPYVVYYTKNSKQSRRPSAWVTDLYVPIGPAIIIATPADTLSAPVTVPANTTLPKVIQEPKTTAQAKTGTTPVQAKPKNTPTAKTKTADSTLKTSVPVKKTTVPATPKAQPKDSVNK
jgi:hypothetical protein